MRRPMLILDTAQIAPREIDQKMQCKLSNATGAISQCGELGQSYGFSLVWAGRPSSQYKNARGQFRFEECKRRRISPWHWLAES